MTRIAVIIILCAAVSVLATPQSHVKSGNSAAQSGDLDQSQYHYLRALEQKGDTNLIEYNLGNNFYNRGEFEKAQNLYMASLDTTQDRQALSEAFYNLGNSYYESQQLEPAIKSYIQSLKLNPEDPDTKHNLELALRMMQQQQQQQNENCENEEQQDPQEQEQEQQQDPQEQEQEQNQDQQQQQQDEQQEEQQQQQQQQQQMSKEEAERLLNALMQDEQEALEKVKKAQVQGRKKREKTW